MILQPDCVDEFEIAKTTEDLSLLKPIIIKDLSYGGFLRAEQRGT